MDLFRGRWPVVVILTLFLGLGLIFSVAAPIFESSDELSHYPYVKYVADGKGLPIQRPGEETLWEQEGSQPPLYYALAAGLTFWINTDDLPQVRSRNPHAQIGIPLMQDNKNMIIHSARENWPWRGTVLAVHLLRFFSVLLSAGTVLCTYALVRTLLPHRLYLALGAMALNAFIPMFLFISASVNNDNLVVCLSALLLLLLVRLVQHGAGPWHLVLIGVLLGLACLSKLGALAMLPLAILALALRQGLSLGWLCSCSTGLNSARPGFWTAFWRWVRDCSLVLVPAVLVAGWWYVRNVQLYGDPLGLGPMLAIVGRRARVPSWLELLGEFQGLRINFWGLFGAVNILMRPTWIYYILDALTVLAAIGLAIGCWRRWRTRHGSSHSQSAAITTWLGLFLLFVWIVVEFAALVRWTRMTMASQGRLLFPTLPALCLFFVLGLAELVAACRPALAPVRGVAEETRRQSLGNYACRLVPLLGLVGLVALLCLAALAPFVFIRPAYARPPILTPADIPATAKPFQVTYGGLMRLLAYEVQQTEVRPGEQVAVTLYWQALAPMDQDYSYYIHLFGWHDQPLGQRDSYPGGGNYPTRLWSPGQVVRDTFWVTVRHDALGPTAIRIEAGLYRLGSSKALTMVDGNNQPVGRPELTSIKLLVPTTPHQPSRLLDANLDNRVRLTGCDIGATVVRPGDELSLTLYWQVTGRLEKDYKVFIHLVNSDEVMLGQGDAPPLENLYPTSLWGEGEMLVDAHRLRVKPDARPAEGRVFVGLYDPVTGQRLSLVDAAGQPVDNRILLGTVEVQGHE